MTPAFTPVQSSSQIDPQKPLWNTSTLPMYELAPPDNLTYVWWFPGTVGITAGSGIEDIEIVFMVWSGEDVTIWLIDWLMLVFNSTSSLVGYTCIVVIDRGSRSDCPSGGPYTLILESNTSPTSRVRTHKLSETANEIVWPFSHRRPILVNLVVSRF